MNQIYNIYPDDDGLQQICYSPNLIAVYAPPPLGAAGQVPPSPYPQPAGGYQIPTQGQFVPDQYTLLTGYFLQTADYPFNTPVFAPYTFTNAFAPGQN